MDLSIIIINWNTRKMLKDCLQTVFDNPPQCESEVIVVDNASLDGSPDMVAAEFQNVRLIANEKNIGFARANNLAFKYAKGAFVLLLNSDTLVHGEVLEKSCLYLRENQKVGAMGCRVLNADGSLQHSTSEFPSLANLTVQTLGLDRIKNIPFFRKYRMLDWDRKDIQGVETISGCFMLMRRTCLKEVGLLDDHFFFFGEETDWCKRARDAGWQIHFAPVGTITHFGGGSSGSLNYRRDLLLSEATIRLHRKHGGILAAMLVFVILFAFNVSRAVFWSLKALVARACASRIRRDHFIGVSTHFWQAWPQKKGLTS